MSLLNRLPVRTGEVGSAVVDLIQTARAARKPRIISDAGPAPSTSASTPSVRVAAPAPARRRESSGDLAALAVALLGVGIRHWVNHRNDGCAFCAASGLAVERRDHVTPFAGFPHHGHAHGPKAGRRWIRRSLLGGVMAVGWAKARQVLEENDRQTKGRPTGR